MNSDAARIGSTVVDMVGVEPEVIRSLFTGVEVLSAKAINARFVSTTLGEVSAIRSTHSSRNCQSRRLSRHMSDRDNVYYFACLPIQGGLKIRHLGRSCEVGKETLAFVVTNEEYNIEMSDDLDALWLRVPAQLFQSYVMSAKDILARPIDISRTVGMAALGLMQISTNDDLDMTARGGRLVAQSLLGFIGELAVSSSPNELASLTRHRRKILERACDFIEGHICDEDLSPQKIARGTGVSFRYLSEIFSAEGTSVMRWVQKRRLELCRKQLERQGCSSQLISEVAYSLGFVNISSFNRAFKAHFGRSPRSLLQAQQSANEPFDLGH